MISILMPIYNGIEYINESVMSVIDQTVQDWELIIGINGLSENSIEYKLALEYSYFDTRIRVYDLHHIKGKANALNEMLLYCKYDHIALLDVDDIWLPRKLEKQLEYIDNYEVVGSLCVYFENMDGVVPKIPVGDISSFNFKSVNPIINSSSIIRKSIANWNEEYAGVEDYDLWLRLWRQKKRFYNVDEILVKHRIHTTSAFNTQDNTAKIARILSL